MTYDQLVTLDSIVKYGSFKSASEFLHKSQPSLSVAIKKLEEEFQIKLFDRSEYRPKLTEEGKLFYQKAKLALVHMKSLELFGEELGMGTESEIKVGIDGLAPLAKILCELRHFFSDFQSTDLTLSMGQISGVLEKVLNKEIEIGFTPLHFSSPELETIEIYKTMMIPVIKDQKISSITNLKKIPQVVVTDSSKKPLDESFGVLEDVRRWNVSSMDAKKEIIQSGLGWGRLPNFMVDDELSKGAFKKVSLTEIEIHEVKVYMIRNKTKPMGPITKKLWRQFASLEM
ncbi:MAG: hypothetical protein CME70_12250 [Halobacteriovorax sp.]|nr:hypothetical protein [Halobacteriovorax sp.]